MASKLTFSELTKTKSLEIKMTNILSFYEDIATSLAFKSDISCFEVITINDFNQNDSTQEEPITPSFAKIENVVKFVKPLHRSNDIVDYLIEREQQQFTKLSVSI